MKKTKFTFIDFFIIAVVVVLLGVGIYFLMPKQTGDEEAPIANFTVLATDVDKGVGSLIKAGDEVTISYSADVKATVVSVREEESIEHFFNNFTGKYVSDKVEGKSDVYIELTCPIEETATGIVTEYDLGLRVGDQMPVRKKGCVVQGYVVDVHIEEAQAKSE